MVLPSLYQVVEPLASFGLSANNDGVILDVVAPFETSSRSPAALAGIVPGDRISLQRMRCTAPDSQACAYLIRVLGGLGGLQYVRPNTETELPILPAHGGALQTVRLHASLAPLGWLERLVLFANTVVGIFSL